MREAEHDVEGNKCKEQGGRGAQAKGASDMPGSHDAVAYAESKEQHLKDGQ